MALGIRYGSALHHGETTTRFVQGTGFSGLALGDAGGIFSTDPQFRSGGAVSQVYLAPSRYSGVRKVVFWMAFRHEQTGGTLGTQVRLRMAPRSSSDSSRDIQVASIVPSFFGKSQGTGSFWFGISDSSPVAEGALYPWTEVGNTISPRQYSVHTDTGAQVIFIEFDRFDPLSADFFNDWDGIASAGDDDAYTAYWHCIERMDGLPWVQLDSSVDNAPTILGTGCAVIQAPQAVNRTCIYVPATVGYFENGSVGTTFGANRPWGFPYRASDWDGITSMHLWCRQLNRSGSLTGGQFSIQAVNRNNGTLTEDVRFEETFPNLSTGAVQAWLGRSADFFPDIVDGDYLGSRMRSDSGLSQNLPWALFEIIQESFNRTVVYFPAGMGVPLTGSLILPAPPPPDAFGKDESLFDPLWFENFDEDRILSQKVIGGLLHLSAGNDSGQALLLNADLEADVPTSGLNADVAPELSSTPNATLAFKMRDADITANNPINFAGKRKLKLRLNGTAWTVAGDDTPGLMALAYALLVPNREFLEIGDVFDTGAFAPEGCASTSAGLGEPGVLVITNGSSLPQKFNPQAAGTAGEVEDAGIPTPFEGEVPQAIPDDSVCSPDGGLGAGLYKYRYTFRNCCTGKESDPNLEDIEVDATGASPCALVDFSFAGVRIPGDAQICEICLYRTIEGGDFPVMAKVGCLDPNVTSLFTDDKSDADLDFINEGLSILNAPMPCVPIVVEFRQRLFGMGDIPDLTPAGSVSVIQGDDIVTGSFSVEWTRCLEGRFIKIGTDCRFYEILRVLPPEDGTSPSIQRLRLTEAYEGETATAQDYMFCGRPNRIYFSEPFEPECWPAANFIDVEPGDGDRLMGAVSNFDSLVICKRRKTYLLRFSENPGLEVFCPTRISSDIGCIAPRSFAQVESGSVWLGDRGIVIFDGRTVQHLPAAAEMNDMFTDPDNPRYVRRDRNGRVIDAVGVFYPAREQYLLMVPTVQTTRGCNIIVIWDSKLNNVTVLEFCQEFQSMVVGKDASGNERVYVGDVNGFVWILDVGFSDGVGLPNATGTVRGTVSSAGTDAVTGAAFLDDDSASFIEGGLPGAADLSGVPGLSGAFSGLGGELGLAGVCLFTRAAGAAYDDLWTVRSIFAATQHRLYVTPPWDAETPVAGDEYMIGAIDFDCLFKPQNYGTDDMTKRDWRQIIVHEVEQFASQVRVDLLPDFQLSDPEADTVANESSDGTITYGDGRTFSMDYSKGRQVRPVGRIVHSFMGVRIRNFAPEEPVRILNHSLCVEARESK